MGEVVTTTIVNAKVEMARGCNTITGEHENIRSGPVYLVHLTVETDDPNFIDRVANYFGGEEPSDSQPVPSPHRLPLDRRAVLVGEVEETLT